MACAMSQLLYPTRVGSHMQISPSLPVSRPCIMTTREDKNRFFRPSELLGYQNLTAVAKSSPENDGIVAADDDGDGGVSLGTLKLPSNTDLPRFETLLFQWANSLCQGANLPLPVPLKVDKIPGGVRLAFIEIGDGKTEVLVYIDCLVFPATAGSGPIFRAIRNGPLKDKSPPGEPRIMRSLLQALQKSVEIARV
ncbi:hypothetical protein JCGZ_06788 [Jatropha curcas]|uniref:DUF7148 domain-containing protein n=1 Tax=Jatropha curcas TaxID=180498 RepID=A0A067KZR1_JATCU|nr:uncharacterized protein LOC105634716 [Jatropha curcas]KDP37334.1 hypothetical protein JCGZ_06788 [Jatropha curcas]